MATQSIGTQTMVMLIVFFGGLLLVLAVITMIQEKITVDIRSIFAETMPLDRTKFGVYCFTGHQGSGKTYSLSKYVRKNHGNRPIYSNIHLIGIDYTPIRDLQHLYSLADKEKIIIIYDEIFSLMSKSKKDRQMLEQFLPQMRKVKNVFLTTAQYWLELDITFRRFVRVQISCQTRPLGRFGGILKETYNDAENMVYDQLQGEYVAPTLSTKYSKYEKAIMLSYNTYERVKAFSSSAAKLAATTAKRSPGGAMT